MISSNTWHLLLADEVLRTLGTDMYRGLTAGEAEQARSILKPGSMIAVRGRLSGRMVQKEDRTYYFCEVIAEHVDYLRGLNPA